MRKWLGGSGRIEWIKPPETCRLAWKVSRSPNAAIGDRLFWQAFC
jgi:hypothetical protein